VGGELEHQGGDELRQRAGAGAGGDRDQVAGDRRPSTVLAAPRRGDQLPAISGAMCSPRRARGSGGGSVLGAGLRAGGAHASEQRGADERKLGTE